MQFGIFDLSLGQIMAYFYSDWVVGWVLIISGIITAAWLLERVVDVIPIVGDFLRLLVHIGTHVGFIVGFLDMLVGYVVWTAQPQATIVAAALVITGFTLVMRVLSKFPIAFVFAAAVAGFGTFTLYGVLKPYAGGLFDVYGIITQIVSLKGMVVIFIIIFCVIYVLGGLLIKLIQLIGKVFAAAPVSVLIGLACIAIGAIVILAPTLLNLVAWPTP
ncbi:MAG: hypothetical protein C4K49_00760 [Candidatus Thorarchaeota archaeon]|nr:MAG: hypothetical protein C4K49_00760 [Candidatus Thorarchaeota archaeon]